MQQCTAFRFLILIYFMDHSYYAELPLFVQASSNQALVIACQAPAVQCRHCQNSNERVQPRM